MELEDLSIDEDAPEDVVQFVHHLEENIDPNDEVEGRIWIETLLDNGTDSPHHMLIPDESVDDGVRLYIEFSEGSDFLPHATITSLADAFYGVDGWEATAEYDEINSEYEAFIFESE